MMRQLRQQKFDKFDNSISTGKYLSFLYILKKKTRSGRDSNPRAQKAKTAALPLGEVGRNPVDANVH